MDAFWTAFFMLVGAGSVTGWIMGIIDALEDDRHEKNR